MQPYDPWGPALRIFILVLIVLAFALMFHDDEDDISRQAEEYCMNVHDEVWPDYERSYAQHCTKDGHRVK